MSGPWAAGKGDRQRPVDKRKYDRNYLRIYGKKCSSCQGKGYHYHNDFREMCFRCDGLGYVPKE